MANLFVRVLIFVLCENFSYQTETLELLEMLLNIGLIYLNSLSKSGSKARIRNTYNFILISISNQDPLAAFHSQAEQSFLNSKSNITMCDVYIFLRFSSRKTSRDLPYEMM